MAASHREGSSTLFVRGWIFDQHGSLSGLTLYSSSSQPGTTVSQLVRMDVEQAFSSFPQARLSGFVSLLPTQDIPRQLCLRGSYRHGDTIVNFVFEEHPVSLGIAVPGVTIEPPPLCTPDATGGIALIITPGWEPSPELLQVFEDSAQGFQSRLWIFDDRETPAEVNTLSITDSVLKAPVHLVASMLWGRTHLFRQIVIAGRVDMDFINRQILPLIAEIPTPKITWLFSDDQLSPLAGQIRGQCFEVHKLERLTRQDLVRIAGRC